MALRQGAACAADDSLNLLAGLLPAGSHPIVVDAPARKPSKRKTRAERFWSKVEKLAGADACWLWTGAPFPSTGYGQTDGISASTGKPTKRSAHKVAYELANGIALAPGEVIMHSHRCVSKLCCRPSHLRKGSQSENIRDAARAGSVGKRRITPGIAKEVVARYRGEGFTKETKAAIAKRFGTTPQNVEHILSGRSWSKATGIPPSGKAAQPKKSRAKVEKSSRPRSGQKHLEHLGAAA